VGYTHYWQVAQISQHSTRLPTAVRDMGLIVKHSPVLLAGWDGTGKPKVSKKETVFNGKNPNSFETFTFPGDPGGEFCKTGRAPYDIVVTACLAAAKDVLGDAIEVSSDGDAGDWIAGVQLAQTILQRPLENPIAPRDRGLGSTYARQQRGIYGYR